MTVLDLVICAFMLRVILQLVRANFYNPISQLVWRVTQTVTMPLSRVLPRWGRWDIAATILLVAAAVLNIVVIDSLLGLQRGWGQIAWFSVLKIASLGLQMYTLSLLVVTILSWVGPGVTNPVASVLWSITEPVLRPVRRVLPPIAGLDLSPIPVMIVFQSLDRWLASLLGVFH